MDGYAFVHREHVRFRDLDAMGHINNAVVATYVEQARVEYLASLDVLDRPVYDQGAESMILARLEIDFRAPGDAGARQVTIGVRPASVGRRASPSTTGSSRAASCVAEATTVLVSYDYERAESRPGPRRWRDALRVPGGERTFHRETLPNGLRVLTAPMDHAQSVTCFVMVAAGSRYETAEHGGIAHFAEHMFFKGTERRPTARDIAGEIDSIGGEFNAFTSKEYTGYYVKCAAEHRDIALDVLVDMLRHSKFDPDEIEREKGVIIEEMNMYFDTPRDSIGGVYESLLFGDQPLGRDIIGRKETVRDATRDTFLDYLGHWYRPSRMVVGLGGKDRRRRPRAHRRAARRPRGHPRRRRRRAGEAVRGRAASS